MMSIQARKDIYSLGLHNPYSVKHFKKILPRRCAKLWKKYIENILGSINRGVSLEDIIRRIPVLTYYNNDIIKKAQFLLISNEPGLSKKLNQIYAPLARFPRLCRLERLQKISMHSWLSMTAFNKAGTINGYQGKQGNPTLEESLLFNNYGKIGAFLMAGDKIKKKCKAIHIDLFPFPQVSTNTYNHRNRKNHVARFLGNFNISNINHEIEFIENSLPIPGFLSLYHSLYNIYLLKVFCYANTSKGKQIFIIGNRVLSDKDVKYIVFKFITEIVLKTNVAVRISTKWFSGTTPLKYLQIN